MLFLQKVAIYAIPAVFAITVHEAAHGYAARHFGDRTAEMRGRITLNPVKHIDPIGTVVVPLLLLWTSNFIFGWAKPVPVVPRNLRNPRRDMAVVAAAGPGANLLMALGWAIVLKFSLLSGPPAGISFLLADMAKFGILINAVLGVLNMLPLPPLDGGNVLTNLLPPGPASALDKIAPYGLFIIFALLLTGLLRPIMEPGIYAVVNLVLTLVGLSG